MLSGRRRRPVLFSSGGDSAVHDETAPKIEVRVNELLQWADTKKGQRLLALAELRRTSYYERPNHLYECVVGWIRREEDPRGGPRWDVWLASAMPMFLLLLPLVGRVEGILWASWCTFLLAVWGLVSPARCVGSMDRSSCWGHGGKLLVDSWGMLVLFLRNGKSR